MAIVNTYKGTEVYNGRKVIIDCEVGSRNYNVNDATSDNDRKLFILPTFEDFYYNNKLAYNSNKVIDGVSIDFDVQDIRRLPYLVSQANINYMEVLFSEDLYNIDDSSVKSLLDTLFNLREEFAKMNLVKFYYACIGMHHEKLEKMIKDSNKYAKAGCSAYRVLDILKRYHDTGFTSFDYALRYDQEDKTRKLLLKIKHGDYSFTEVKEMLSDLLLATIETYKPIYTAFVPNNESYKKLDNLVLNIVKTLLFKNNKEE